MQFGNEKKSGVYSLVLLSLAVAVLHNISLVSALGDDLFINTSFYNIVSTYLIPTGMTGLTGLIIGIVSLVILVAIFLDIIPLVAPFSKATSWIIALGLAIIMIALKWNVTLAGWAFGIGSALFGWVGTFAIIGNVILGILVILAIFFPLNWLTGYLRGVRTRRKNIEDIDKARRKGGKIRALGEEADEALSGTYSN